MTYLNVFTTLMAVISGACACYSFACCIGMMRLNNGHKRWERKRREYGPDHED